MTKNSAISYSQIIILGKILSDRRSGESGAPLVIMPRSCGCILDGTWSSSSRSTARPWSQRICILCIVRATGITIAVISVQQENAFSSLILFTWEGDISHSMPLRGDPYFTNLDSVSIAMNGVLTSWEIDRTIGMRDSHFNTQGISIRF